MHFNELNGKTIGIWGMGKEGIAAKQALEKYAAPKNILEIGEDNLNDLNMCDIVIKSPGVSLYRPEIERLHTKGITVTSGTNIFLSNHNPEQKIIAVTGTKGKSTTSSLLHHVLKELGIKVALGGNIGVPLLELLGNSADIVVAELSSYQCADVNGKIDMAVLVNLYPEHLPWHKTHERYYLDKLHMVSQAKQCILNAHDKNTNAYINKRPDIKNKALYFNTCALSVPNFPLKGEHNLQNASAVLKVVEALGLDTYQAVHAMQSFQSLPHRLDIIGQTEGITYVDDSISTTPETAIAAMEAFKGKPITLIMGGQDRGQDYTALADYTKVHNVCVITLPDTGRRMDQLADTYRANNMKEAVDIAKRQTPVGGIVLLSPAAPSYNMYKNFEERGEDFKRNVFQPNAAAQAYLNTLVKHR